MTDITYTIKYLRMRLVVVLLVTFPFGCLCQLPAPSILIDPDSGPLQGFGAEVVTCAGAMAVWSFNEDTYDGKLSFFVQGDSLTFDLDTAWVWDYIRHPHGFVSLDSTIVFRSRYMNSVWGDRNKYIHLFEKLDGNWIYNYVDADSFFGGQMNIGTVELTKHGAFVSTSRNFCGYNQSEWYQVLDFQLENGFNGPFCNVIYSGSKVHGVGDRVFLTKNNDDRIYELQFDEDENFTETIFFDQDFGQYQNGNWTDVFQLDSLFFCVMDGFQDYYQGPEVVTTTLIQVFEESNGAVTEVYSFNLSELLGLADLSFDNIYVDDEGFIATDDILLRFIDGELELIGEISPFPTDGFAVDYSSVGLIGNSVVQGVPSGNTAGFGAGEVFIYDKLPSAPSFGCLDEVACNYSEAEYGGVPCSYPSDIFDCDGNCVSDFNGDGICDQFDAEMFDYLDGYTDGLNAGIELAGAGMCGPGTYWDEVYGLCLPIPTCHGDLNDDGYRGIGDLLNLLSVLGTLCN